MKHIKLWLTLLILIITISAKSQILITLLLGDKLNSDKIEFGLVGGLNSTYLMGVSDAEVLHNYNLGFYFHFSLKNNSYLSTGVLVKSNTGASGMSTYPIGDPDFDNVFKDGELTTKVNYFQVPLLFQQRFYKIVLLEAGVQTALRSQAYDYFYTEDIEGGDITYKVNTKNDYTRLDFGLLGGLGFKLSKQPKSISIGANYYYGLVNISKVPGKTINNSVFYLYMKIPIGVQKKD